MLGRVLIVVALVALLASSASAQTTQTSTDLMPGVTLTREVDFTPRGPVVLDVVTAPRPDGSLYTLQPVLSNDFLPQTEKLTDIEKRLSVTATTVAVNGDSFDAVTGLPSGIVMRGGALDSEPAPGRSAAGFTPDGTLTVARVAFKGTWQGSGQRRALDVNNLSKTGSTLYTSAFGPATPVESGAVVEDVFASFPPANAGRPLTATVSQVTSAGSTPIPPAGAVLVSRNTQGPLLTKEAPAGQQVEVRLTLTPDWSGLASSIGGGPLLVSAGKPVFRANESFDPAPLGNRNARSAVGQLADGRILLVTVEGVTPAYSVGMTNYELAVALARLGAVTAIGLGTGPTAEMAFDGTLLTRPSGGTEAPISDALVLAYVGVYAAPPAAAVLSPNGDGVNDAQTLSYKLVRPSHVSAVLTGPGGVSVTLAADDEQPGVHSIPWNGAG
ncbi:MAG: phosphodiester glycosidase family protein, partial [Actinobacteria bacterium]|nr:phosphodiester glycosidase family protein [Actinomycetota bacterium]